MSERALAESAAVAELAERFAGLDGGIAMYGATLYEGTLGAPGHGAMCRWDWGVTASTLALAWQRRERLQRMLDDMTPEQRAALWSETSPLAAELRKLAR